MGVKLLCRCGWWHSRGLWCWLGRRCPEAVDGEDDDAGAVFLVFGCAGSEHGPAIRLTSLLAFFCDTFQNKHKNVLFAVGIKTLLIDGRVIYPAELQKFFL